MERLWAAAQLWQPGPSCTLRADRPGGDGCRGPVGSGGPRCWRWAAPALGPCRSCSGCTPRPSRATLRALPLCASGCASLHGNGEESGGAGRDGWEGGAGTAAQPALGEALRVRQGAQTRSAAFPPRGVTRCCQTGSSRWPRNRGLLPRHGRPCWERRRKSRTLPFHAAAFRRASPRCVPGGQRLVGTAGATEAEGFQLEGAFRGRLTPAVSRDSQSPSLSWAVCGDGAGVCTAETQGGFDRPSVQQGCR